MVENVRLDRLLEFCARYRFLQNVREHLAKCPMFRRTRLLAVLVLTEGQVDVDRLPDEVPQILARKFDEAWAQENVIMNVVYAERQVG